MNNAIRTTKSERDILECFQETLSPLDYTSSTLDTLKNRESGIHGFLFSTDQVERNEMFYHNNNSCTVGKTSGSILVSNLNSSLPLSDAHRSINFNNSNNNSSNSLNTMNFLMVPNNTPREQISTNTDWRNNYSLDAMYDDAKDSKDCANGLNFEAKERRR